MYMIVVVKPNKERIESRGWKTLEEAEGQGMEILYLHWDWSIEIVKYA